MIVIGVVLLLLGFLTGIGILWTIGIIALVIGLILLLVGSFGHPVAGRRWYWLCWLAGRSRGPGR
jgi:hypothetical protein